jgi:hypothetical protein
MNNLSPVPYGYRVDDDGVYLVEDELEQQVIQAVRLLRSAGLSHHEVYSELEKRGLAVKCSGPGQRRPHDE